MLNTLASMERFKIRVGEKWNFKARKKTVNNLKKRVGSAHPTTAIIAPYARWTVPTPQLRSILVFKAPDSTALHPAYDVNTCLTNGNVIFRCCCNETTSSRSSRSNNPARSRAKLFNKYCATFSGNS